MNRRFLGILVRGLWALLILSFLAVLFASLDVRKGKGSKSRSNHSSANPADNPAYGNAFADVLVGQTKMQRYNGKRVWVTRLSNQLSAQLQKLDSVLRDPSAGCSTDQLLCVIDASSLRDGIDIVFSAAQPANLPSDTPWYGGFVDPTDGSNYDLLGRAYRGASNARVQLDQVSF